MKTDGCSQNLGFGEYRGWVYSEVLTSKQPYLEYLLKDNDEKCPQKMNCAERIHWEEAGITEDGRTGAVE